MGKVSEVRTKLDRRRWRWKYYVSDKLLHFEAIIRQRQLVSKIEAKCGTFWPPVKFIGEMSEMSEWILGVGMVYFWRGISRSYWNQRWVSKKDESKAEWLADIGRTAIIKLVNAVAAPAQQKKQVISRLFDLASPGVAQPLTKRCNTDQLAAQSTASNFICLDQYACQQFRCVNIHTWDVIPGCVCNVRLAASNNDISWVNYDLWNK